ncbi:MAG: hypothetical protein Q7S61_04640 [bacterium]|nr:hypothetical protein [bacterium]
MAEIQPSKSELTFTNIGTARIPTLLAQGFNIYKYLLNGEKPYPIWDDRECISGTMNYLDAVEEGMKISLTMRALPSDLRSKKGLRDFITYTTPISLQNIADAATRTPIPPDFLEAFKEKDDLPPIFPADLAFPYVDRIAYKYLEAYGIFNTILGIFNQMGTVSSAKIKDFMKTTFGKYQGGIETQPELAETSELYNSMTFWEKNLTAENILKLIFDLKDITYNAGYLTGEVKKKDVLPAYHFFDLASNLTRLTMSSKF